ncbi:molybdate ABC transporter substrate-binding protein [Tolypothrix sp. VBCCA 56010]|uniref:molybdate ABC transporter substrate-binding protein n=1 Tax=Tolypothrix sp. VBCCA 56010 TaxID=3137731 RepID=UPI003D7DFAC3
MKKRQKLALATASLALGCGAIQAKPAQAAVVGGRIDTFAAASLTDALPAVQALYQRRNPGVTFTFTNTFGASGTLVNQILMERPTPIDIFFPVSQAPLNTLESNNKLIAGTRQDLLRNTLAIIAPINSTRPISSVQDLTGSQVRKIAIGDPAVVPAGQFATQLFNNSGISDQIQDKLVLGSNVREVLSLVASPTNDGIDAGVVYTTDALTQPNTVKIVNTPSTDLYNPIVYQSAVLQESANPNGAIDFNNFLASPEASRVFARYGFTPVNPVPEPLTIGGSIAAGAFGIAMKRKVAAKAKAKAGVN